MTEKECKSCVRTIELLRRLAYNIHGVMDVIDAENCDKIISMLEQEPKTGHWIDVDGVWFKCSECDAHRKMISGFKEYFCPNCGAKMESEE